MRRRDSDGDDEVRAAVAALGPRRRTTRIPDAVRARVLAYTGRQRALGYSWARIAHRVGLSVGSLRNWARTPPPAQQLVRVAVTAGPERSTPTLVVVSPGGYRLEGLDLATATAVLRALG
jgi:hypothetical protein